MEKNTELFEYILAEIRDLRGELRDEREKQGGRLELLGEQVSGLRTDLEVMKIKSGFFGMIGGSMPGAAHAIYKLFSGK